MPNFISEDQIEQALVQKLQHLHGFDLLDCYTEDELELFDLLKKDKMTNEETRKVRLAANPFSIAYAKSHQRF